jgi:hypothetical protein
MSTFNKELSPLFCLTDENLEIFALKGVQDMFRVTEHNVLSEAASEYTQEDV